MENISNSNGSMETDDFTNLIQRIFTHKTRHLCKKKTPGLVFKRAKHPFLEEIRTMMCVFGDVEHPLNDSACMISKILKYQMNNILKKASQVFSNNHSTITHKNLLYLFKDSKERIWQLLHYLNVKDLRESYNKQFSETSDILKSKRTYACSEYLNKINKTKEFYCKYDASKDPIYIKRISKRYARIQNMSDQKYEEFSKKLQVSFLSKDRGKRKFEKWLLEDFPNLQLTTLALEILNFLARETVAEIVESSVTIQGSLLAYPSSDIQVNHLPNTDSTHITKDKRASALHSNSNGNLENSMSIEFGSDVTEGDDWKSHLMFPNASNCNSEETLPIIDLHSEDDEKPVKVCDSTQCPIYPRTIREVMHQFAYSDFILDRRNAKSIVLFI